MTNQQAYDQWAASYDDVKNLTRDLELTAKQKMLEHLHFDTVLELGCGTGKNTSWLLHKARHVTAVDFSENMLAKARERITDPRVTFAQADIRQVWGFADQKFDLITCSLVLEHISDLQPVFAAASVHLKEGGYFYIGELHPFKQYEGSKARLEADGQQFILDCYTHHLSEFTRLAKKNGFTIVELQEWFDEEVKEAAPRIVTLLLHKT